jgi:hypothetical protein
LPGRDFESRASASSATSAIRGVLLPTGKNLSTKNPYPNITLKKNPGKRAVWDSGGIYPAIGASELI